MKDFMIVSDNKGNFYWKSSYKEGKKTHQIRVNAEKMSLKQAQTYGVMLESTTFNRKEKLKIQKEFIKASNNLELKKINQVQKHEFKEATDEDIEKLKLPSKNYGLEREKSRRTLSNISNTPDSEYDRKEMRIILRIGNRAMLKDMDEEMFKTKLEAYMGDNGKSPHGQKFLDDIINKWGDEFKE